MKNIVFFSKDLNIGGMEKSLVILLNELVKFYNITLVLENKTGFLLKKLDKKINVKEFKISTSNNILIRKIQNGFNRLNWLIKNNKKYDFACNYSTYSFWGSRLAQFSSKNNALYVHSNYVQMLKNKNNIVDFFEKHKINKFNKIIFVSNESKKAMDVFFPKLSDNFVVINNLFDYQDILKLSNEKVTIFDKKYTNFIFLGRLENESKNLDLLLNSFKKVVVKNSCFRLYLIGDGPYFKNIEKFILKNNLENNIFMLSTKENPYSYLKNCDCLILTSNYEGFPVVYLEALVLNKQIMTTIPVSCPYIDINDYAIKLENNASKIANNILNFKKKNIEYKIDFAKINENEIADLKLIIEGK